MASVHPKLLAAIMRQPRHLRVPLLTTALIESGGRLNPQGGDGGTSFGPYQMHRGGRLTTAGFTPAQAEDPVLSTQATAREFQTFFDRGARGASLAYRAQRPADQQGYMARYADLVDDAQALLGGARAPMAAGGGHAGHDHGGGGQADPMSMIAALRALREPGTDRIGALQSLMEMRRRQTGAGVGGGPGAPAPASTEGIGAVNGLAPILPGQPQWGSYGYGDPEGQGGKHLAVDWFGAAGTDVRSPVTGRVVRVSMNPNPGQTASGQVFGGTLGIRDGAGRLYVMRHLDPLALQAGQRVTAGQHVGDVTDWSGSDHVHFETYRRGSSDREYGAQYAINPRDLYRRAGVFR